MAKKSFTLLDLCVSSLRRGHANLLCIVPILTDDPQRESALRGLLSQSTDAKLTTLTFCSSCKISKADSTLRCSQAVPHPSTSRALSLLTSEVERDPVYSTWYGRQQCQCRGGSFYWPGRGYLPWYLVPTMVPTMVLVPTMPG